MSTMHGKIKAMHGTGVLRKSALNIREGGGAFEWALAGRGYRTIVEIGTYRGCSAAEMAQYCERVVTIDLKHGKLEHSGEAFSREGFWRSLGINNIDLKLVKDDHEKALILADLEFDFAFIDGGHTREAVERDFALVRRCGNVLFHDADDNRLRETKPDAPNDVFEFLSTLPQEQLQFHDIFALWTVR
jgi:predicted O-methyltransferase YrrM